MTAVRTEQRRRPEPETIHRGWASRLAARLFPGDRRVWRWSLLAIVPMVAIIGYSLFQQRSYYTGTDSVGASSIVGNIPAFGKLCVPDLDLPGGTGGVQIAAASTGPTPPLSITLESSGRVLARGTADRPIPLQPLSRITIPITPALPVAAHVQVGTLCIVAGRGAPLAVAGFAALPSNQPPPTINGRPLTSAPALWFVPPSGRTRSLVQSWSAIMHRLTLFRPGFAGTVFYWLLFLLGLPLLAYWGLRLLAVAGEPGRRLALGLAIVGFAGAAVWAITTVPFDSPDESEHFAYTESIAEAGRAPDAAPSARPPYAQDEAFALDATHHFAVIAATDSRPPWFARDGEVYRRRVAVVHPRRDDGGGFSVATGAHSPLYYTLLVPGYELGRSGGTFAELFWMRLIAALLGAVVVVAAFGTVRELVPARPELAVAAGLLVAFQPMFSFISGAVNNDNGVNALAALAVYLTVRALHRGISWRLGLALGATVALLPIMKGTGLALVPAVVIAMLALVLKRRSFGTIVGIGVGIATVAALAGIWDLVAGTFQRSAAATTSGASVASGQLGGKLTYLWEVFFPRLPFMAQHWATDSWPFGFWPFKFIYVERGFAAFGWYADFFPHWVYDVILLVMGFCALLAMMMAVRRRADVIRHWPEAMFLILVILGVIVGVEFAFYAATPRPIPLTPEQGRYAFTALIPLAALALAGLLVVPRRRAIPVSAVLVAAMICFALASHLLYVAANFT